MIATSMNHEARQVCASVEGLIRRVNRNSAYRRYTFYQISTVASYDGTSRVCQALV
jgi:hypothetical protein